MAADDEGLLSPGNGSDFSIDFSRSSKSLKSAQLLTEGEGERDLVCMPGEVVSNQGKLRFCCRLSFSNSASSNASSLLGGFN